MPTPGPNSFPSSREAPLSHPLTQNNNPIFSNTNHTNSNRNAITDGLPDPYPVSGPLPGNLPSPLSFGHPNNHSPTSHGVAGPSHLPSQSFFPSTSIPMAFPNPNLNYAQTHTTAQQPQFQPQFSSQGPHTIHRDVMGNPGFQSATFVRPSDINHHWSASSSHLSMPGETLVLDHLADVGSYHTGIPTTLQPGDQVASWENGTYADEVMVGGGETAGGWSSTHGAPDAQDDFY
ncbi:hypothetical protein QBC34DRAFT_406534, partial [Podospora aff. communis PSN243]